MIFIVFPKHQWTHNFYYQRKLDFEILRENNQLSIIYLVHEYLKLSKLINFSYFELFLYLFFIFE